MRLKQSMFLSVLATGITTGHAIPANAALSFFIMADRVITNDTKKAIATPGHAVWCAAKAPGYRKKWNNWRLPNGRVKYCASPYHTPVWMRGRK